MSHVGVHPSLLPRSSIRPDVFHLGCAIGKGLITYLRSFAVRQSQLFQNKLVKLLATFWPEGVLYLWKLEKPFTSLKGDDVKRFVLAGPDIADLLIESFVEDRWVLSIAKALRLWYDIERFLKVGNIQLEAEEKNVPVGTLIDQFEKNITEFYLVGSTTFMKANRVGDRETYYLHCLRFYIPKLARETWERHQCGIGIYSMQGFERRNKESKSIMNKFNNNKQHRIPQQLRRLWDIFFCRRKKKGRKKQKVN